MADFICENFYTTSGEGASGSSFFLVKESRVESWCSLASCFKLADSYSVLLNYEQATNLYNLGRGMMRMRAYMERHLAFCTLAVSAKIYSYPKQLPFPIVQVTTVPVLLNRAFLRGLSSSPEWATSDQKAISPSITKYSSQAGSPIRYTFSPFTYFLAEKCGRCARERFSMGEKRGMRVTACCFSLRVMRQLRYIHRCDQAGWVIWRAVPERRVSRVLRSDYCEKSQPKPHQAQRVVASRGEGRGYVVCSDAEGEGCEATCPEKRQQLLYAGSQCCYSSSD